MSRWLGSSVLSRQLSSRRAQSSGPASISLFELFSIGIGPSSSHTVGPMRAARFWAEALERRLGTLERVHGVSVTLYGSLAATGEGHSTPLALALGLQGHAPATVDPSATREQVAKVWSTGRLALLGKKDVAFGRQNLLWAAKGKSYHFVVLFC